MSPRYLIELVPIDLERAAHEPRVVVEHAREVLGSAAVKEVALALHLQAGRGTIQNTWYVGYARNTLYV